MYNHNSVLCILFHSVRSITTMITFEFFVSLCMSGALSIHNPSKIPVMNVFYR